LAVVLRKKTRWQHVCQREAISGTVPDYVRCLFKRDWFTRMWTVQEAALAHQPLVMCGSRTIYWNQLVSGIQHASNVERSPEMADARNAVDCIQFFWLCLLHRSWDESDARRYGQRKWSEDSVRTMQRIRRACTQAIWATMLYIVSRLLSGHWRLANHDLDAWLFIALVPTWIIIYVYFSPPMELVHGRSGLLRGSLVVNINRIRRRDAGDRRDMVFALYGTMEQLGIVQDRPQYMPDMTVAHVYHQFAIRFIYWHKTLDLLTESCYPPPLGAPTWVPDLSRMYNRWDVENCKAAGDSSPDYWFIEDRTLCTTGQRVGRVSDACGDAYNSFRHRFVTEDIGYTGTSPAPVEIGDLVVLVSGLRVPMVLRVTSTGFHVIGLAQVDGIMDGEAWISQLKLEIFTLV
jgi:hypothetical protein